MIGHLLKKEVAEHWRAFLVIAALEGFVLLTAVINTRVSSSISVIRVLVMQLSTASVLGATIAMQVLFATEVRNKTILFLEALPISRAQVVIAKLSMAFVLVYGTSLLGFVVVMGLASRSEPIDARFFGIVGLKTLVITTLIFGLTFLAAAIGRYRYPLYVALFMGAFLYEQAGGELREIPPFSLLGDTFVAERQIFPLQESLVLTLFSAAVVIFGLSILLLRSGSVAMLLGEKMSHREKVLLAGGMLAFLFAAQAIAPEKVEPPYAITSSRAIRFEDQRLHLTALPPESVPANLPDQLRALRDKLEPLVDRFGARPAPLFLIHRGDLDGGRFETATVEKREGILVRANLEALTSLEDLAAFCTARVIDDLTEGRAKTEPRVMLRDGFATWFAHRDTKDATQLERLWLRALFARREGFGPEDLDRWFVVREALGEPISSSLAWSGVSVLEETIGAAAFDALLREAFDSDPADGLKGWWRSRQADLPALLSRHGSIERADFLRLWRQKLDEKASLHTPALAVLPQFSASKRTSGSEHSRAISVAVRADRTLDEAVVSLLWRSLPALDAPFDPLTLRREEQPLTSSATIALPRRFAKGTRVFVAGSLFVPALGCEARFGAERSTVR